MTNSVDQTEIQHFSKDSDHWWDESGPFKPLHRLNPVRISYLKEQICQHFGQNVETLDSLKDLSILDVGCGGGLVCEPLCRLGAKVSGIDADANAIAVAKQHAKDQSLNITYKNMAVEDIQDRYDVVLALEILEHVSDPAAFVKTAAQCLKPGGIIIFSTLNRNPKSLLLGVVAAEYILRWVPQGTHNWKKFIKPSELARYARRANLKSHNVTGLIYNPVNDSFTLSKKDLDVNYFLTAKPI